MGSREATKQTTSDRTPHTAHRTPHAARRSRRLLSISADVRSSDMASSHSEGRLGSRSRIFAVEDDRPIAGPGCKVRLNGGTHTWLLRSRSHPCPHPRPCPHSRPLVQGAGRSTPRRRPPAIRGRLTCCVVCTLADDGVVHHTV